MENDANNKRIDAQALRLQYPAGTILRLTAPIEDPYTPKPAGARLRVSMIDDAGQIHGTWLPPERGSIAILPDKDQFVIEEKKS